MSTLIERMILRTQAPLSSLEPIAPVRYAPTQSGQQPDEAAFTEIPSPPAEATDHAVPAPAPTSMSQNALLGEGQHRASLVPPKAASPSSITPANVKPSSARRDRRAEVSPTESVLDANGPRRDNDRRPAARASPVESPHLQGATTAAAPRALPPTTGQTASTQPIAVTARLRPVDFAERGGVAAQPPVSGSGADEPASGPDITVTIGHIEVRAAQAVPARPARRPFRPQVSLADFLMGSSRGSHQ